MKFAQPLLLLLLPVAWAASYYLHRGDGKLLVQRGVLLSLLVLAAANPTVAVAVQEERPSTAVTVIDDSTGSMGMFEEGNVTVEWENASSLDRMELTGNSSPVGDALRRAASKSDTVVLRTDGRVTEGASLREAAGYAASRNVTVFGLRPERRLPDTSVEMRGPKNVVQGENRFTATVRSSSGGEKSLDVTIDGEPVVSERLAGEGSETFNFTVDLPQGGHVFRAEVSPAGEDAFPANDVYRKSVWAAPKPEVLLVGGGSSLEQVLDGEYRITGRESLGDVKGFKTVVLNDLPESRLSEAEVRRLQRYVAEGGGLVVVGGENSYNRGGYRGSGLETLLPTTSEPSQFLGGVNLVVVMDVSDSTGQKPAAWSIDAGSILELEKSNALNLIGKLKEGDRVAAITFGGTGFTILPDGGGWVDAEESGLLKERIRRLQNQETGGTLLSEGLREAENLLGGTSGSKSVVVLTDGEISSNDVQNSIDRVQTLQSSGVSVHFVQIGQGGTLTEIAKETSVPLQSLGQGEIASIDLTQQPPQNQTQVERFPLSTSTTDHFVIRGLGLDSSVTGFNDVTPKPASDLLVTTDTGRPVLASWSFGLGRVASLATDDGTKWASSLYSKDPRFVTRTVNWAVEDPRQKDGALITAADGEVGSPLQVTVEADSPPDLSLDGRDVGLTKTGGGRYAGTVTPSKTGLYRLDGYPIAVNYPGEYRSTGVDPDLSTALRSTGGELLDELPDTVSRERLRSTSSTTTRERRSLRTYLLAALIVLFVAEVVVSRWREVKTG